MSSRCPAVRPAGVLPPTAFHSHNCSLQPKERTHSRSATHPAESIGAYYRPSDGFQHRIARKSTVVVAEQYNECRDPRGGIRSIG